MLASSAREDYSGEACISKQLPERPQCRVSVALHVFVARPKAGSLSTFFARAVESLGQSADAHACGFSSASSNEIPADASG